MIGSNRQRNVVRIRAAFLFGGALRDIPKDGCEGDYIPIGLENKVYLGRSLFFTAVVIGISNGRASLKLFNHIQSRQRCSSANNAGRSKNHQVGIQ